MKGNKAYYICNECKQTFTKKEFDSVEMERCPKCNIAYHHKIGSYDIIMDIEKLTMKLCKDICWQKECSCFCRDEKDKPCMKRYNLSVKLINKGWIKSE